MTVDFIFEFLSGLLDGFLSSNSLLIISMLVPCLAIFGFITVYALVVIYAELKVSSFIQDKKPYYALAIAVGCPGIIDNSNGVILDSRGNNTFKDFHITDVIRRHIDTPIAVLDRVQAMFHRVTSLNKNQDNNDALFIYFEDGFCISTIKVGGLYFPGDYFQFGKNSSKHAITLDQEQLSKKIFEIANSLDLKKIYMHSKETSNLIDGIITTLSGWDRKIDVTRPVVNEDTTLKGLIDIASSIAYENQTVIFR